MDGQAGALTTKAIELALAGVRSLTIVNRTEARGLDLVATLRGKTQVDARFIEWRGDYVIPKIMGIVVNATSIGLYAPDAMIPLALDSLRPGMVVADVVFSPPRTRLLHEAEARGCIAVDGLGMLVNQGVIGVKFWTGINPDPGVMRMALEQAMGL